MTRTTEPASEASTEPSTGTGGSDALHRLHRMSRTAGLGETDYVAVNGIAVAALLFGIGSALVVFDEIFLVIPVIAIVLAIIAARQVGRSNGTQTGRGLSWTAIVLAILCTAILGSQSIAELVRHRRDGEAIASVVQSLGQSLSARNYPVGYALTSTNFHDRVAEKEFADKFDELQNAVKLASEIKAIHWSGRAIFEVDNRTSDPLAHTIAHVEFKEGQVDRIDMLLRKVGDRWFIDDIPAIFPRTGRILQAPRPSAE